MAELTPQDRLQPALLDRLTDDEPEQEAGAARSARHVARQQLRQAVLRDLAWLFNTTRLEPSIDLGDVRRTSERSVLNFGLPALSGRDGLHRST